MSAFTGVDDLQDLEFIYLPEDSDSAGSQGECNALSEFSQVPLHSHFLQDVAHGLQCIQTGVTQAVGQDTQQPGAKEHPTVTSGQLTMSATLMQCDNHYPGQQQQQNQYHTSAAQKKRQRQYPNWKDIDDVEERRKQRRLAKNRATAARSRERQRAIHDTLQQHNDHLSSQLNALQDQNGILISANQELKAQNESLNARCQNLEGQVEVMQQELAEIRKLVASRTSGATPSKAASAEPAAGVSFADAALDVPDSGDPLVDQEFFLPHELDLIIDAMA